MTVADEALKLDHPLQLDSQIAKLYFEKDLCGESLERVWALLDASLKTPGLWVKYEMHKGDFIAAAVFKSAAVGPLLSRLNDEDEDVRSKVEQALAVIELNHMTASERLEFVAHLLKTGQCSMLVKSGAALLVDALLLLLDNKELCCKAVDALVQIMDIRAAGPLMERVLDGRLAYTEGMRDMFLGFDPAAIGDGQERARLLVFADMPSEVIGIDVPVSGILVDMLRCEYVRETAVLALVHRDLEARPFLLNSLKDKDSAVCCAAIEALTMLDEAADLGPLEKLLGD
ncbi:MAG: HEAT repeat domain-containing protein, partial [Opitutales bacterium]